jgi:gliding motility-associated-like protein
LNFPIGLAVDNSGTVYLTDTYDNTIRKIVDCALSSINLQPVNTVICSGQSTAFSVNGSNVASYQWQMNSGTGWNDINDGAAYSGTSTGTLAIVNSDVSLNNNQYRCKITGSCNSLFSTAAMLTVNSQVPGVSITAPSNAAICSGGSVTFTAVPLAGGTAPSYQWQLGGVNVGTNSPFYTVAAPADGDVVQCVMISNATCLTTPGANSNSIAIRILPPVTPAVSITASSVSICANIPVTFSASADNGGPALSYQWEVNGVGAGTNSMTYTTTDLNDGDVINCIMTGGAACMTAQTAPSNDIVIKVNRPAPASISISTPSPPVCKGDAVTFITTIDNGGNTPVYHWKINGIDAGTNENTFTSYNLANGDRISCVLTSSIPCVLPVSSEDLPVVIKPLPVLSAGPDTAVFPGNSVQLYAHSDGVVQSYSWSPSEGLSGTSLANPIAFATDSVTYYLTVTAEDGCQGYAKVKISLLRHLLMPNAFTPNHDGRNDVFRIPYSTALDLKDFSIFDRWGRLVFKTKDISKGWDGYLRGTPADAGSYVYLIRGNFQGEEVNLKGTVILIR